MVYCRLAAPRSVYLDNIKPSIKWQSNNTLHTWQSANNQIYNYNQIICYIHGKVPIVVIHYTWQSANSRHTLYMEKCQ